MRILFIHQKTVTFVQRDLEILRSGHNIEEFVFKRLSDVFSLWKACGRCDVTFSWFGKLHALFAVLFSKILGKKSVVVAGGDDVAHEPEISYGMFSFWWKRWCPRIVFRYADLILPVSRCTERETIHNAKADPSKIVTIYHGFEADRFKCKGDATKKNLVVTISRISDETVKRKGLELFVQSAALLHQVPFLLIGPVVDTSALGYLQSLAPENLTITGPLEEKELIEMVSRAKVFAQLSIHEAFGCAIAEAMLMECIPVVTSRAAIPEVVGEIGFYVDELSPPEAVQQIQAALEAPSDWGKKARERILHHFPLEARRERLLRLVDEVSCGLEDRCRETL